MIGGKVSLSQWFSIRVVSELTRSVGLRLLGLVKSAVGWKITPIYSSYTACICSSSLVLPSSSVDLDDLVGKFLGNSTYSDSP